MKVLYIFSGSHKAPSADAPDAQLYGLNYLEALGIQADAVGRDDALSGWLRESWLGKLAGFKTRHALLYFTARSYDVVFGPALLYLMPLNKLFGGKAKYVVLNIELNRILRGGEGRPLRKWFIESLLKEFSAIVCLSTDQKEWLLARYPSLVGRVFFVPFCADIHFYLPEYEGRNDVVLSVGRDNGRDYRTLLEVARQMPETQFEIVCSPRNLVDIEDVPTNVRVYYDLSFAELREKYQTARMIVITTHDDSSTLGADCSGQTVLLDAMACGLPIIATHKAYLADYVRDGQDALVVDCYNPKQLAAAIVRLTNDAALRVLLAKSARSRAEREFSTQIMAESLSHIFKNIWNN